MISVNLVLTKDGATVGSFAQFRFVIRPSEEWQQL